MLGGGGAYASTRCALLQRRRRRRRRRQWQSRRTVPSQNACNHTDMRMRMLRCYAMRRMPSHALAGWRGWPIRLLCVRVLFTRNATTNRRRPRQRRRRRCLSMSTGTLHKTHSRRRTLAQSQERARARAHAHQPQQPPPPPRTRVSVTRGRRHNNFGRCTSVASAWTLLRKIIPADARDRARSSENERASERHSANMESISLTGFPRTRTRTRNVCMYMRRAAGWLNSFWAPRARHTCLRHTHHRPIVGTRVEYVGAHFNAPAKPPNGRLLINRPEFDKRWLRARAYRRD